MGPLPSLVLEEQGERTLAALLRARHDLPSTIIDEPDARIPLVDMIELFDGAARVSGDPFFGLSCRVQPSRGMRVVGRRGDRQHAADRLDPVGVAMVVDEGES